MSGPPRPRQPHAAAQPGPPPAGPGRSVTARPALLWLHRWTGLVLGLVLAVIGATGSILAYQREIDAALNPALFRPSGPADPGLTYAAILRLAEAAGRPVGTIRPPDAVWPVWVVSPPRGAPGATTAYLDPATGDLLGARSPSRRRSRPARPRHCHRTSRAPRRGSPR